MYDFAEACDPAASAETIFRVHHEICILSGNSLLPVVFYSFKALVLSMWERYFRLHGNETLVENTRELYNCFQAGDQEGSLSKFRKSITGTILGINTIYHGTL